MTCILVPIDEKKPWRLKCERCGRTTPPVYMDPADLGLKCLSHPPSLTDRVKTYANSTKEWIKAGKPLRSDDEVNKIAAICFACIPPDGFFVNGVCTHKKCGCNVRSTAQEKKSFLGVLLGPGMINKLRRATEKCPIGKW